MRIRGNVCKSKTWWNIFGLFAIIIMPEVFTQFKVTAYLFALGQMIIFSLFFIKINQGSINRYILFWGSICMYLFAIMGINGHFEDVDKWGRLTVQVADVLMIFDHYVKKGKSKELLSSISTLGAVYFCIQTVFAFLRPTGFLLTVGGYYHFLGLRTALCRFFFVFFTAAALYFYYYGVKAQLVMITVLAIANFVLFAVSTAISAVILLLAFFLFREWLIHVLTLRRGFLVANGLNLAFIFFNAASSFAWFIEGVLKRSITLTNRTIIWRAALEQICDSLPDFLFGHGLQNNGDFAFAYGIYWPAHNQLLQWLFEYGLIGLIVLFLFYMFLNRNNIGKKSMDIYIVLSVCTTMFITGIASSPLSVYSGYIVLCFLPYLSAMRQDALQFGGSRNGSTNNIHNRPGL